MFGDYISVYDIQRAVDDGATVPIYDESRLAKLALVGSSKRLALVARDIVEPADASRVSGEERSCTVT